MTAPLTLRWYQRECIDALFEWFRTREGDVLVTLPTGSGKSAVLSAFIAEARANHPPLRAVVLAAQAELVKQNAKAAALFLPRTDIGIYSASLGIKEIGKPITIANIQSLAKRVFGFDPPDLIVVDEAQNISDNQTGLYRQYFNAVRTQNPGVKIVGLTATPFKLSSGRLDQGEHALFAGEAYSAPLVRLIEEGFLCRPRTPRAALAINTDGIATRGGEFILKALSDAVDIDAITNAACDEMVTRFADRSHWLAFCCSIEHCQHVAQALAARGIPVAVVHGELPRDERAYRLDAFSRGEIRALVSCELLGTGYDEPRISGIAMLRPTKSAGLYIQQCGRGLRVHPSKTDCLILDFSGNVDRFGVLDAIRIPDKKASAAEGEPPAKVCPVCEFYQPAGCRVCPNCGHEFPPPPVTLLAAASTKAVLSIDQEPEWHTVTEVRYHHNHAKLPKLIDTLRVEYYAGFRIVAREWVCLDHPAGNYARAKAVAWWQERSPDPCPASVKDALERTDELRTPTKVGVLPDPQNPKYTRIARYEFADAPRSGLPRACWSCAHWNEFSKQCDHWHAEPPADVQQSGCDEWNDEEALPF